MGVAEKSHREGSSGQASKVKRSRRRHRGWKALGVAALLITALLIVARLALPTWVRWYVNRTIDRNPLYEGKIGSVEIHLLRGGYAINDVRLDKTTGNVPVPFFSARRVHFEMQWGALLSGKFVGRVFMDDPQINFVDSGGGSADQTGGGGGPWLAMIRDLFPFKINSAVVRNGSIHFRAFDTDPPVDVYLSKVNGRIENLTNIHNEVAPMISTVEATGLAMNQAKFEFRMKLDPFSYRPTFDLGLRLLGLDVTQVNSLSRAYGQFDFEHGFFDLVIELKSREGEIEGYVKPLFRNVQVLSLSKDIQQDNVLQFFWEALVGLTTEVFKNQRRDQFGTVVPLSGSFEGPRTDLLSTIGNVLRNAFIRAYLPRFQGTAPDVEGIEFGKGEPLDASELGAK